MTFIVDPGMVETEIIRLSDKLEKATDDFGEVTELASNLEAEYRVAFAKSFVRFRLQEKASEKTAEAQATVECEGELRARKAADGRARHLEETCRSIRAQLDAVRTLSANVRSQT